MFSRNSHLRRFLWLRLFVAWGALLLAGLARAQELKIYDAGQLRRFEIAADEVQVVRKGAAQGTLKTEVEGRMAGARVLEERNGTALVKLPARLDRAQAAARSDAVSKALPGAELAPVLYEKGRVMGERARRIGTRDVLVKAKDGESPAQVRAAGGAVSAKATIAPGWVMLTYANAHTALAASESLRAKGYQADAQLARMAARRFVPNDPSFPDQWHLRNVGQGNGTPGIDANPIRAWDFVKGNGVTISIVDDCLELNHPDLNPNCPPVGVGGPHHDFNDGDDNPAPSFFDSHGTSCGGVAGARGGNALGVSGGAPEARLIGLRLISGAFTDQDTANALFWRGTGANISISSNSWGPFDDAHLEGPGILARQALQNAAQTGRGDLGVVIVWAGGNGLGNEDDVALDGFASSKFVLAVAANENFGFQSDYSEEGSALVVCAPSNGGSLGITTTDTIANGSYTPDFGGTSSATPLVAGTIALLLEANPNLSYRDVKEILMGTAVKIDAFDSDWVDNGAGFHFNHKYGAGMIDASAAVARAQDWTPLGAEQVQQITLSVPNVPANIPGTGAGLTRNFDFSAGPNLRVEHVEVVLKITHAERNSLEIRLISPQGTTSRLVADRSFDDSDDNADYADGLLGWTFMSTHHWGENSAGTWTVRIFDRIAGTLGTLDTAQVRIYGTPETTSKRVTFETARDTVNENPGGTKTVRIKRLGSLVGAVSVDYAIGALSTTTNGADYTLAAGTASFADGQQFADLSVAISDDLLGEGPESLYLTLKNPVGAALGGITATVLRIDDDEGNAVFVTASDPTAAETLIGSTANPGSFLVTRSIPDANPLTVNVALGGTATAGADYTALAATVVIPPDQPSATVTVAPMDDNGSEGAETVTLTVQPASVVGEYNIGTPPSAVVTIVDNDLPAVQVTAAAPNVPEASTTSVDFIVSRPAASSGPLTVLLEISDDSTAIPGTDYFALPAQVTIPAGSATVNVPLQPKNTLKYRAGKFVRLEIAPSVDYSQGFLNSARIDIGEDDPLPDVKSPAVTILSPKAKARIDVPTAVVANGTAADNQGPPQVIYRVNDHPPHPATGSATWTADLTSELVPGPNILIVFSQDPDGNFSKPAIVGFNYVQPRTLTVNVTGGGAVTKSFLPSIVLEAGQTYTIVAKPAAGFVFAGWSGGLSGVTESFTFKMPNADTALNAAFVTDPFLTGVQGTYTGPVQAGAFAWETSGLLQLAVTGKGACSGALNLGGAKLAFRNEFNGLGRLRATIPRPKSTPLTLDLTLDIAGAVHVVTGTVSSPDFTANVIAERAGFSKAAPYPFAATHPKGETYTFILPAETSPVNTHPFGTGYGTFTIDAAGNVKWTATLADDTTVSGAAPLTATLHCPLYASLYTARGLVLGDLLVNKAATTTDVTGTFDWFKPESVRDKAFPGGFTRLAATVEGALYAPPAKPPAATAFGTPETTLGAIGILNGNVPTPINQVFTLKLDNKLTINGLDPRNPPNGIFVTLSAAKGTFAGSFLDPKFPTKTVRKFEGVILLKTKTGRGGFLGDTLNHASLQTGTVTLAP